MSVEAMKQALEAFEDFVDDPRAQEQINASIAALRQAIAEAEKQEPVAWMDSDGNISDNNDYKCFPIPLYTHPPKREWVGLTDKDILDALQPHYEEWEASELLDLSSEDYKLIEAKLKEKNT